MFLFLSTQVHAFEFSSTYKNPFLVSLHRFLSSKWGFDAVYNRFINQPILQGAYNITFSLIDKGLLEVAGPTGGSQLTSRLGAMLARVQTGSVPQYAAFMLVSFFFFLLMVDNLDQLSGLFASCVLPTNGACAGPEKFKLHLEPLICAPVATFY